MNVISAVEITTVQVHLIICGQYLFFNPHIWSASHQLKGTNKEVNSFAFTAAPYQCPTYTKLPTPAENVRVSLNRIRCTHCVKGGVAPHLVCLPPVATLLLRWWMTHAHKPPCFTHPSHAHSLFFLPLCFIFFRMASLCIRSHSKQNFVLYKSFICVCIIKLQKIYIILLIVLRLLQAILKVNVLWGLCGTLLHTWMCRYVMHDNYKWYRIVDWSHLKQQLRLVKLRLKHEMHMKTYSNKDSTGFKQVPGSLFSKK